MPKFSRRIYKFLKNPRNVLVLGTGFGFLEEICDNFSSVFIISTLSEPYRKKNLIYRESFDNLEHLPDIDVIVMDKNQYIHLENLRPILNRYHPLIFVESNEIFEKNEYKLLKGFGFSVTEMFKGYHMWKFLK